MAKDIIKNEQAVDHWAIDAATYSDGWATTIPIHFYKIGRLVVCSIIMVTSASVDLGAKVLLPSGVIPQRFLPNTDASGYVSRADSGIQGTGSLFLTRSGELRYGINSTGVAGVSLSGSICYISN